MDFDKNQLMNKLDKVSDEELKNMVKMIAQSVGITDKKAEQAVSDISKLRKSLGGMSEKELNRALSMLDDDTVSNIKKQMNM